MALAYTYNDDEDNLHLHGVLISRAAFLRLIEDETNGIRYERIGGRLYDMGSPSGPHSKIAKNIERAIDQQLDEDGPCETYRDRRVAIPGEDPVAPDVVLSCTPSDYDREKVRGEVKTFIQYPRLVIEVLSPRTARFDQGEKFERYKRLMSLQAYILLSQDRVEATVYQRKTTWREETFTSEQDVIALPELELQIALADVYRRVFRKESPSREGSADV
jgi:Uma2 family endonuclease